MKTSAMNGSDAMMPAIGGTATDNSAMRSTGRHGRFAAPMRPSFLPDDVR